MKTAAITLALFFATILGANANSTAPYHARTEMAKLHQQKNHFSNTRLPNAKPKKTNLTVNCDAMRGRL